MPHISDVGDFLLRHRRPQARRGPSPSHAAAAPRSARCAASTRAAKPQSSTQAGGGRRRLFLTIFRPTSTRVDRRRGGPLGAGLAVLFTQVLLALGLDVCAFCNKILSATSLYSPARTAPRPARYTKQFSSASEAAGARPLCRSNSPRSPTNQKRWRNTHAARSQNAAKGTDLVLPGTHDQALTRRHPES